MSVLLIAEHNNKELRPFTYNAVSAASKIDEDLHILVLGNKSEAVAKSASEISNVKKVSILITKFMKTSLQKITPQQ